MTGNLHRLTLTLERLPAIQVSMDSPHMAAAHLSPMLAHEAVEVVVMVCLDARHRAIGWHEVGRGSVKGCQVDMAHVCRVALLANASAVILAHNHPSGDTSPSPEDVRLTRQAQQALTLIGLSLVDHVIIGEGYCSLRELGIIV